MYGTIFTASALCGHYVITIGGDINISFSGITIFPVLGRQLRDPISVKILLLFLKIGTVFRYFFILTYINLHCRGDSFNCGKFEL